MAEEDDKGVVQAFVDAINLGDRARIEAMLIFKAFARLVVGQGKAAVRH